MGPNRFWSISRFLRIDNANNCADRLATDKAAVITDILNLLNANLRSFYSASGRLIVDEQLFACRGRTRFTQFMLSKPAKCGIKVWWVCNVRNSYPLTGQIYTGKVIAARETNQGERVVKDLCRRNFATRLGIECVLGKPLVAADYEENPGSRNSPPRDAIGLRKVVGNCFMCMSVAEKRFRKTRKLCNG
ncbi:hypothetical protein ILUMI_27310 [Ignelater luminosus]|uniref:PiggyBac transposable element-derived protein domain-containing protein n=1 Tax=Ignelater luminosus TaxID=2038154 RepID=A0A8K0C868_IGNLU|nr:hypothetical protein ILUMI_27310 [Ignelater luminosus]